MMRTLIEAIPFWWLIALTMVFFMILSYLAAAVSVLLTNKKVNEEHRDIANTLIGILSGGFSILVAFVIINTWNYLLIARETSSKEADSLAIIVRNAAIFAPQQRDKIINAARNYALSVRLSEWKIMKGGREDPKAWAAIEILYSTILAYPPQTDQEKIYYPQILTTLNELLKARRQRLNELSSIIPPPLRTSLIAGSIFLAITLGGIRGESNLYYLTPLLLFALALGFNLALALSFDYPFSGPISVSNKSFYNGVLGQFSDK